MKPISKQEKEFILAHNPNAVFHKTVNHNFAELSFEVIKLLEQYNKINVKTRSE